MGEPERKRGEEIAGGSVEGADSALGDGLDAESVGKGNFFELGDDAGNALRELVGELAEVSQDGRQAGGEEEREEAGYADDQEDDCYRAGRMVSAQVETSDADDERHENDSEERADVENQELFPEGPGEGEEQEDDDAKDDVTADFSAGSLLVGAEVFGCGAGQLGSPWVLAPGADFGC